MTPQLDLAFARHPRVGTHLARRRAAYPYCLTTPFRLDAAPADLVTVIVQSASGAILGADRLHQRIAVGSGASGQVTTQAALAVHRMAGEDCAEERVEIAVEDGGYAEYLPAPRILFPGAALVQRIDLTVAPDGCLILADGFACHDPDGGDRPFRRYAGALTVARPGGEVLATDAFDLDGPPGALGFTAHGMLVVACPPERGFAALAAAVEGAAAGCFAAASPLPSDAGVALRLAARDGAVLHRATRAAWAAARLHLTGAAPGPRRGLV